MADPAFSSDYLTLTLLVVALFIFVWLASKSRSPGSFQFQVSVFIGLMVAGAIVEIGYDKGIIQLPQSVQNLGFLIHVGSMVFFSIMIWFRYYMSKKTGTTIIEEG